MSHTQRSFRSCDNGASHWRGCRNQAVIFDGDILRVRRRIYEGKADTTKTKKSARDLPIPDALRSRLFSISGREWIFESGNGTPVNPGNALKRYVRPAVRSLGIKIGGWHDFRHALGTMLRKHGWSAKVRADILGHSSLQVTDGLYDHSDQDDFREALGAMASEMLRNVMKPSSANPSKIDSTGHGAEDGN